MHRDSAEIPCWCICRESPVWIKRLHFKRASRIGPLLLKLVSFHRSCEHVNSTGLKWFRWEMISTESSSSCVYYPSDLEWWDITAGSANIHPLLSWQHSVGWTTAPTWSQSCRACRYLPDGLKIANSGKCVRAQESPQKISHQYQSHPMPPPWLIAHAASLRVAPVHSL